MPFQWLGRIIENTVAAIVINKSMAKQVVELNKDLMKYRSNPTLECMEDILGRDIKWVDQTKFNHEQKKDWYINAQALLRNKVFISLVGGSEKTGEKFNGELVKDLIEEIAKRAPNYDVVRDLRAKICGIELIRELVDTVVDPDTTKETNNDPFGVV